MSLEKFSSQYYMARVYISSHRDGEAGKIYQAGYDNIREQVYGPTVVEPPLIIKIEGRHIQVQPASDTPSDTISLPKKVIEKLSISNPPSLEEVFFPTSEAIKQLDKMGYIPN